MAGPGARVRRGGNGGGHVTSHDVARAAGVSQSTVSRALRDDESVAATTRERIKQTAAALGYTPSEIGRSLVTRSTKTIAMLVTDLANPFYPYLIAPLHDELSALGYRMLLLTDGEDASTGLVNRSVDGAVLTTTTLDDPLPVELAARGVPFVFLTREGAGVASDAAVVDNALGASLMAAEVLRLGHRRIGALFGPRNTSTGVERERGTVATLRAAGVELDEDLVRHTPFVAEAGYGAMQDLMALPDRPTVVICGNDSIAIGALNAARGLGIAVPHDVSIVGFDDLPIAAWELVQLTTVHQPMEDMARTAGRLLVERIEGHVADGRINRVVFEPRLFMRATLAEPQTSV